MKIVEGTVVRAKAGRDENRLFAVTGITDSGYVYISDGDTRKLASPKKKNVKHLAVTKTVIELDGITDKRLKMNLRDLTVTENESEV
ncbi:MAG: KOW domain-containing RNA-binding protein [Oscillospiraceae bacterium]|nr:KOW domain-containing RNA-binding protein [Oscillospiraceae bacterium]MBR6923664.1 KOW domain-containing RNA-binding protein [Oscillospiraceae bacterium]